MLSSRNQDLNHNIPSEVNVSMSKAEVIDFGLKFLSGVGAEQVCKVCIANGASCCTGCKFLSDGIGCQQRNTSCTSWLCGFLKLIYYKAGILDEWNEFWTQVPGLDYRKDRTPEEVQIKQMIEVPDLHELTLAFAEDLDELAQGHYYPFWVMDTKETLDRYIDQLLQTKHPDKIKKIERKISYTTKDFHRFHEVLRRLPLSD